MEDRGWRPEGTRQRPEAGRATREAPAPDTQLLGVRHSCWTFGNATCFRCASCSPATRRTKGSSVTLTSGRRSSPEINATNSSKPERQTLSRREQRKILKTVFKILSKAWHSAEVTHFGLEFLHELRPFTSKNKNNNNKNTRLKTIRRALYRSKLFKTSLICTNHKKCYITKVNVRREKLKTKTLHG